MTADRSGKRAKLFAVDEAENDSVELVENVAQSTDALSPPTILCEPASATPAIEISANVDSPGHVSEARTEPGVPTRCAIAGGKELFEHDKSATQKVLRDWEEGLFAFSWFQIYKECISWLWNMRAPLLLLGAIALVPKLVLVWILIVLAKPVSLWLYRHCPDNWKTNLLRAIPNRIKRSAIINDLSEGADQGLPFILFWLYLCCAPFALLWMAVHWIKGLLPSKPSTLLNADEGFVFTQNMKKDTGDSEDNFYYSRAFGIVFLAFFALGIPAFCSFAVYEKLGIEQMMKRGPVINNTWMAKTSALPPPRQIPKVGLATRSKGFMFRQQEFKAPEGSDATFVTGYNGYWPWIRSFGIEPNKASVFFVHFYLVSLACALCILFFRAWFLFPLNFLSDEHDVQVTASGIRRSSLKGWFLSVLTMNRWSTGGGPDSLKWQEIKCLRRLEEGFTRLYPLPETAFKRESLSYKLLNKVAAFIDGLSNRMNTGNYLVFSTADNEGDFGRNIKINLNDLNREQRARLFYAVKRWAPHVTVRKSAEEQLLGSTVLQDVRYTQLWFDLLTCRTKTRRQSILMSGETLKDAEYTIEERLSSGGQATAYLARRASGDKCVLKEFILATSSSSGALIESAREFEAEVSLLSQLSHPGIVNLQDFFTEDGRVYVALEYIEGQTLRQKVQQEGPLTEEQVVRITKSVCDVLEYLHGLNPPIVHRDITPENIIIANDGTIKLIDFSLAVKSNGWRPTDSCGKQAFTPPEQFRDDVTVQSDIYALGATMYYLLTGQTPKPISSSSPRSKADHVSLQLNAIVERATQLELNQRYESVHWLKLDVASLAAQQETSQTLV